MGGEFEKVYQKSSSTLLIFRNWKVKGKRRMIMKVYKIVEKNCQCDNGGLQEDIATNKCGITEVTLIIHIDGFLKGFIR